MKHFSVPVHISRQISCQLAFLPSPSQLVSLAKLLKPSSDLQSGYRAIKDRKSVV
jgi:hypothetical protein